ncbi:MAG: LysR family transcriptional regulator [Alphaproteobacteria bacterium]|nr:LysR family transcriptional regulator [Alphaproteobacteria bacterium]
MNKFDWSLVQSFLAVAEDGSFSAAARSLGISQPTVGRQIAELERQMGTPLFQRENRGHRLTDAGGELLGHAHAMQVGAAQMSLAAAGQSQVLSGTVRITASVVVSHYLLPSIFADIRRAEPEIELELNPSDATENLLFREADIAVRMYRPEQLDVITRKVGAQRFGLYASRDFIAAHGQPETLEEFRNFDVIGYDRSDLMIEGMRAMGIAADRSYFTIRCDNQTVYVEMVRAGCGIGVVAENVAAADDGLVRVLPEVAIPDLPIWLTAHAALRSSPRIRRIYDLLAEGLIRVAGA